MQILEDKALVFKTRTPERYSVIPKHKVIERDDGGYDVAVYWGLDECRVLRNLGVKDVPSPITRKYHWPGRYKPMKHQIETSAFLTMNRKAFVFSEPGTGKTLSALWAADYLMQRSEVRRCLILCPLSIMHSAWMADLNNSIIHRSAIVAHHAQASRRIEMIQQDYEFVITNYEGLNLIADEINADGRFDLIIVDEANAYKTVTTRRWKALKSIIKPSTHVWMMTGTPASQSPVDAYGLAKIVNPDSVPRFFGSFRDKVMTKLSMYKWVPKHDSKDVVHKILQPAIRFTKAECLDLPDLLYTTREVPLTAQQAKYYDAIRKQMATIAAGEEITATNAAAMLNKLLQISQGSAYTDNRDVVEFDVSNRYRALTEVIEGTEHKVLVFMPFRHSLQMVQDMLIKDGYTVDAIHGDVSPTRRGEIIKRFQTEDTPQVLLLVPQATAHGITLTRADQVVWWGPVASTELYIQANSRAHRAGQTNKVTVTHLQGSPVERRMYTLLQGKVDLHLSLVELYRQEIA